MWATSQATLVNRSFLLQVNPVELYCCCKLWWVMSDDTAVDWQQLKGESEFFCSTLHLTTQILIKRTCSCQNISAHQQVWSASERTDSTESDECQTRSRRGITTVLVLPYVCHCHFSFRFLRHVVHWCKTHSNVVDEVDEKNYQDLDCIWPRLWVMRHSEVKVHSAYSKTHKKINTCERFFFFNMNVFVRLNYRSPFLPQITHLKKGN